LAFTKDSEVGRNDHYQIIQFKPKLRAYIRSCTLAMSMILSLTLCELKREDRTHRNVEEMEENSTSEKQTLGTEAK